MRRVGAIASKLDSSRNALFGGFRTELMATHKLIKLSYCSILAFIRAQPGLGEKLNQTKLPVLVWQTAVPSASGACKQRKQEGPDY